MVTGRLVDLASVPRLFNDRMGPDRVTQRMDRVLNWLGTSGRIVASEHIRKREIPPAGKRKWARGGYAFDDVTQD
jgi:hypothetical protein